MEQLYVALSWSLTIVELSAGEDQINEFLFYNGKINYVRNVSFYKWNPWGCDEKFEVLRVVNVWERKRWIFSKIFMLS